MRSASANLILALLTMGYINCVKSQCASPFASGDAKSFCYYYDQTSYSWSDGYNQCLSETVRGIFIEIRSAEHINALKDLNIGGKGSFWLGANNFGSFLDAQWHWLDGSPLVDSSVTWCPTNTHETATGAQCAAYNSTLNCVTNHPCSTSLSAPCVAATSILSEQAKAALAPRLVASGTCTNSYGGAYANWWTYSILLLNWFILFCFTLYGINHLNLNRTTIIITVALIILSFMVIITFAILWGVQYRDILRIPLAVVILGSIACLIFLIDILILVSDRNRVQRWIPCVVVTIAAIVIESFLMLGLILCTAYCSGYISLTSTVIDKDVIAALLASIAAAISIILYNAVNYFLGYAGQDRVHASRSAQRNPSVPYISTQGIVPRRPQNNDGIESRIGATKHDKIERATSPVDQRILDEFYSDQPKTMHQYELGGRQYVVYEGNTFGDIEPYKRDLTQAMLLQEPQGLEESISRAKASAHAPALAHEINQAENLLKQLK